MSEVSIHPSSTDRFIDRLHEAFLDGDDRPAGKAVEAENVRRLQEQYPVTPSQGVGIRHVLPLLVLVSLAFAPVPPSSELDLKIFQGKWLIWENGKKMEASVEGNQITLWSEARAFKSCRIELAASAKPKRLDLIEVHKIAGKVVDGFVWSAIYTIDKDTVTICSGISGDDRPHAFRQDEKRKQTIYVFNRKKP